MAATGGTGRRSQKRVRKKGLAAKGKPRPIGRPPRLAHRVPGSDRQQQRERSIQAAASEAPSIAGSLPSLACLVPSLACSLPSLACLVAQPPSRPAETVLEIRQEPPAPAKLKNVLCLPNPEWLPHELIVSGPQATLARFREAASGPGCIPWVIDYERVEEDWVLEMLTPPPALRGISLEGARILARHLRERVELQDMQAAEAAFASKACALDLHALVPIPDRILSRGPNDPAAVSWLWENWGTTWALRCVEEITNAQQAEAQPETGEVRYRFWSADWTPWRALASIKSRWPEMMFQIAVRAVSE
jgi:hypothetical protein